jgi:phosphatidylserine decarboxylase
MRFPRRIPLDPYAFWPMLGSAILLGLTWLGPWSLAATVPAAFLVFFGYFFRDPERQPSSGPRMFLSPADGVVTGVYLNEQAEAGPAGGFHVTTFLAVWNVHVSRVPQDGVVEKVIYVPGGHAAAWKRSAAGNESNWMYFRNEQYRYVVRQVAGKIARRVVSRLRVGDTVRKGQRLGMIRLGSRTDLYLPVGRQGLARPGDKARGGTTVVAVLSDTRNGVHS